MMVPNIEATNLIPNEVPKNFIILAIIKELGTNEWYTHLFQKKQNKNQCKHCDYKNMHPCLEVIVARI